MFIFFLFCKNKILKTVKIRRKIGLYIYIYINIYILYIKASVPPAAAQTEQATPP